MASISSVHEYDLIKYYNNSWEISSHHVLEDTDIQMKTNSIAVKNPQQGAKQEANMHQGTIQASWAH